MTEVELTGTDLSALKRMPTLLQSKGHPDRKVSQVRMVFEFIERTAVSHDDGEITLDADELHEEDIQNLIHVRNSVNVSDVDEAIDKIVSAYQSSED